ncbi:hypothetical protein DFO70_13113 [Cytobacillus firmus]|uniref:Uncharacterized protein n=2 Tax=Cytobacillus TaxID=2675230 RepID=A0A366JGW6_CYTFI|nr:MULTISPECIES: hypothetical protein [Cytobacillus]RBP86180.1 hypothetical protein DFO70_13113 [Cytobacillus firmus]TDX36407.1 hypothetical protein DFO72_12024 [Cytobacillus oceanisediminis]
MARRAIGQGDKATYGKNLSSLIWRRKGYASIELNEYYIESKLTHAYFFHDWELKQCGGCYPHHWFAGFVEVKEEIER